MWQKWLFCFFSVVVNMVIHFKTKSLNITHVVPIPTSQSSGGTKAGGHCLLAPARRSLWYLERRSRGPSFSLARWIWNFQALDEWTIPRKIYALWLRNHSLVGKLSDRMGEFASIEFMFLKIGWTKFHTATLPPSEMSAGQATLTDSMLLARGPKKSPGRVAGRLWS